MMIKNDLDIQYASATESYYRLIIWKVFIYIYVDLYFNSYAY